MSNSVANCSGPRTPTGKGCDDFDLEAGGMPVERWTKRGRAMAGGRNRPPVRWRRALGRGLTFGA